MLSNSVEYPFDTGVNIGQILPGEVYAGIPGQLPRAEELNPVIEEQAAGGWCRIGLLFPLFYVLLLHWSIKKY